MGRTTAFLGLVRPFTLLAPVVGVSTSAAVAAAATDEAYALPLVLAGAFSSALATGASNAWNQAFDVDADRINKPERPVASGRVTPARALLIGDLLAVAALVAGALASETFLLCVAVGLLATWVYSAPPLRLKRRTVGALLTIAIPRGVLVPVAGWSILAAPDRPDPWALGAVAGLFVLGAAATKDFSDVEGDRADRSRTLPVLLGARRAARVVAPFLVMPFLLYPVFGLLGWLAAPLAHLGALAAILGVLGLVTVRALLADPEGMGRTPGGHPAWRGMYLLLLGSQFGTWAAYAL